MAQIGSATNASLSQIKSKMSLINWSILYSTPLYYISVATAMSCPINLRTYTVANNFFFKIYSCFMVCLVCTAIAHSYIGRKAYAYYNMTQTAVVLDVIDLVTSLISNVYALLFVFFYSANYLRDYFKLLKYFDTILATTIDSRKYVIQFHAYFLIINVSFVLLNVYDCWAWTVSTTFYLWLYYAFRLYSMYLDLIIILQICMFCTALRIRFNTLNERLLDTKDLVSPFWIFKTDIYIDVKCLMKLHDSLCDVIDTLNYAYGFNIVMMMFRIIVNCVLAFNLTMIFVLTTYAYSDSFKAHLIVLNMGWALFFMALGLSVARSCDSVKKEARYTATLAYKLLSRIPTKPNNTREKEFRTELSLLAKQVEQRRPTFSACGFFPINNSMMYGVIGSISSYIIIILQFNNSPMALQNTKMALLNVTSI